MDMKSEGKYLELHPDTVKNVRKLFNLENEDILKESIDLLEDWVMKQNHFVKRDFRRDYLERMLIAAKGSVERTKERIDRACTLRTLMPHYFEDFNPKEKLENTIGKVEAIALPKLTADNRRYVLISHYGNKFDSQMLFNTYKYDVMLMEYAKINDYASAYELILDYRQAKITEILPVFNALNLRDLAVVVIEGYGLRVKGIHVMIDSSFADIAMTIAKQVVPKKLVNRIHLHKNLDDLHKLVQADILPVEYGGKERSSHDLCIECLDTISSKAFREYWRVMIKAKTDETKRNSSQFNEQYLGMPGSFRTLSVD